MRAPTKETGLRNTRPKPKSTATGRGLVEAMGQAVAYVRGDASAGRIAFPNQAVDVASRVADQLRSE